MKYFWLLAVLVSIIAGTLTGEITRKASYARVDSADASDRIVGDGHTQLHCQGDSCLVCFDPSRVPSIRDAVCRSTPGLTVLQPFAASLVTAAMLTGVWLASRRRSRAAPGKGGTATS